MSDKYIELTPELYEYTITQRSACGDAVLDALRAETEALGGISGMQINREQGSLLTLLVAACGVRRAVEVGTFTGYSSTCIARGLPDDGRLVCCDVSEEWTSIARRYWERAGVADKVDLRLGAAVETLQALSPDVAFDFAFVDADKSNYDQYYELLLPRMRRNALIIFDNMLWHGPVVDCSDNSADTVAIRALNKKLSTDERVESVLIPVADGLNICRKK
jgi:caffeoyl-CoA O-methyltransferase